MPLLFSIETPTVRLTWSRSGKRPAPAAMAPALSLDVTPLAAEPEVRHGADRPPSLVEQTDYTVLVQSRTDHPVALRHSDPVLLRGLHAADDGRLLHGAINFRGQVGYSRFVVEGGGVPQFAFTVEVVPSKLDYQGDYAALREDVRAIADELLYEHLRATYQPGRAQRAAPEVRTRGTRSCGAAGPHRLARPVASRGGGA